MEMVELNVHCVVLSARVLFTCCWSVLLIALVGIIFRKRSNNCYVGARYAEFERLNIVEKTSYVLGSEKWEDNFNTLMHLVKEFIMELCKQKLYSDDS